MDIRSLRYFVTIVDCGSLSRASRSLYIAQSALSYHIAALEEELETQLLYRSPAGVKPTPPGEILYHSATSILRQFSQIPAQVKQHEASLSGRVAIGIPTTTAEILAMPLLQEIMLRLPSIQLDIDSNNSGNLLKWLSAGRLDFSLLFITEPIKPIVASPLLSEDLCLVWAKACPEASALIAGKKTIKLHELVTVPLVLPPVENGLRNVVDAVFEHIGATPNVIAELGTLQTLKLAMSQGMAASILPLSALGDEAVEDTYYVVPVVDPPITRTISICTNTDIPLSPAAQAVCTHLVRLVSAMCEENTWPGQIHPLRDIVAPVITDSAL